MNIKVKNCINCPLCVVDQFSNEGIEAFCSITLHSLDEEETSAAMEACDKGIFIPSWCPLKVSDATISLDTFFYN
jgi:hypothetical protein